MKKPIYILAMIISISFLLLGAIFGGTLIYESLVLKEKDETLSLLYSFKKNQFDMAKETVENTGDSDSGTMKQKSATFMEKTSDIARNVARYSIAFILGGLMFFMFMRKREKS